MRKVPISVYPYSIETEGVQLYQIRYSDWKVSSVLAAEVMFLHCYRPFKNHRRQSPGESLGGGDRRVGPFPLLLV